MSVKNLAMTLIKNQISGAPVAGKNGKIVGVVSEADIVAKKGKDVKAIMSKKVISVSEETPVEADRPAHDHARDQAPAGDEREEASSASSAAPISSAPSPKATTSRCTRRSTICRLRKLRPD